jgi:tetratricopeptide (TPR) repeat protein
VGVSGRAALLLGLLLRAALLHAGPAEDRFREANDLVRAGDYPRAISAYAELARTGNESATLYWNWAQAASARGAHGEALWALLRARELDPSDRAVARDAERLRASLNLDPAEVAPEPLAAVGRFARRYRLDLVAVLLLAASVLAHALGRTRLRLPAASGLAWTTLALGLAAAAGPLVASLGRPTAAVVRRGAPLLDAASPSANPTGTLREGEVVPVLDTSGDWLQVEDNAGARGWAHQADVRRLDRAPAVVAQD